MPKSDGLVFVPLGGSDEIGMNLYLYGLDGKWLMLDCGIGFGDETTPGIEILMPDPGFIEDRRDDLLGIVLTHGHEDHLGAIQYLWSRFECPVFATPFTAALLRFKLRDVETGVGVEIVEVPLSGTVSLGPFEVRYIGVTHSIPESNAVVLRTRYGTVVHTGDWKLDAAPLVGELTQVSALREAGQAGVLAAVSDSTNALEHGHSRSEAEVRQTLIELIAREPNRVAVTGFATNLARIQTIAHAAHANGRHCALIGRSLWRIHAVAAETGYLDVAEPFVSEQDAGYLPRDKVVLVCTGSQGEPRAALTRIARDDHPNIVLEPGDTVIFSAREIPGNEKAIARTQNALVRRGIRVITPHDETLLGPVHVSGHPAREDLAALYQWLRPQIVVPVHGDPRRQHAHARFAHECQVPETIVPADGMMIRLAPGPAEAVGQVPTGRLALDGSRLVRLDTNALRQRHRLVHNGAVMVSLIVDGDGWPLADPQVGLIGIEDAEDRAISEELMGQELRAAVEDLPRPRRRDDDSLREAVRQTLRRSIRSLSGKKPMMEIHLVRL